MGKKKDIIDIKYPRDKRLRLQKSADKGESSTSESTEQQPLIPENLARTSSDHTVRESDSADTVEPPLSSRPVSEWDAVAEKAEDQNEEPQVYLTSDFSAEEIQETLSLYDSYRADQNLHSLLESGQLSDDDDDDEEEEEFFDRTSSTSEPESFIEALKNWHRTYNISNVALAALLCILRTHLCFSFLPKTDKAFLQTPASALPCDPVAPGHYHHIGIKKCLKKMLSGVKEKFFSLELLIGLDGLPHFKSKPGESWPILMALAGIPSLKNVVLPIGVYYGPKKPNSVAEFLKKFIEEANELIAKGFDHCGTSIPVRIKGFIMDTPAKAYILRVKGHTGNYSCTKCKAEGKSLGHCMTFPVEKKANERTHQGFIDREDEEFHSKEEECPLVHLKGIDFKKSFPVDYMHLISLGIVRTILYILNFAKAPFKLPFAVISIISQKLIWLATFMPVEFNRKPRGLDEVRRWKATEFRTFILYVGVVAMTELRKDYPVIYENILCLHIIMTILLSPDNCRRYRNYAESLIDHFMVNFQTIYGLRFVTHNLHNLSHLPQNLDDFKDLEECSAFKFENCLKSIKKLPRKPDKPLQQICLRFYERIAGDGWFHNAPQNAPTDPKFIRPHSEGPLLPNCTGPQYRGVQFPEFRITNHKPDYCCYLRNGSIIIVRNIAFSSVTSSQVIIGQKFEKKENFYPDGLIDSSLLGIHVVSKLLSMEAWPVSEVSKKLILLPFENKYVVFPLLHCA